MTAPAVIAVALIWFASGWVSAELYRAYRHWRMASVLAKTDEVLCSDATVVRERTGEIAWYDNERPMERM